MQVAELMTGDVEACLPTDDCVAAGEIMCRRRCGFVPVIDNRESRRVVGVVTDRDIALYLTLFDARPSQVALLQCMTSSPKTVTPRAELREAAAIMSMAAVGRLPVVERGRLVGVLTLGDLARQARLEWPMPDPHPLEEQVTDVVEAICVSREPSRVPAE